MSQKSLLEGFLDYACYVEDPRIERNQHYLVEELLLVTLCASICGAEGWSDLELFGKAQLKFLRQFLPFKNGVPTDETFRRFFRCVNSEQLQKCFVLWVKSFHRQVKGSVAIDGKTLRRSYDNRTGKGAIHMVSAWASEQHLVLGQIKTEEKSNEITAIPKLLDMLALSGTIVTIDAMGTQKKIAKKIREKKADYVLALKGNHEILNDEVERFFARHKARNYKGCGYNFTQFEEVTKEHGRIEQRNYVVNNQVSWLTGYQDWDGLAAVVMVESTRTINGKTTTENRYYISSMNNDAKAHANPIRNHWGVESLHWVLDVTFNEDQSRIRKGNAPQNMAVIRHIVLNMIKMAKPPKISIRATRKLAGWDQDTLLNIIMTIPPYQKD